MAFLDILSQIGGETKPIRTAIDQNRNFLRAHGMGMLSGDLKAAAAAGIKGTELDTAYANDQQAEAAAAQKETADAALREKYAAILRSMGMEEHAKIVEDGLAAPGEVYMDALEQKNAKPDGTYAGTGMDAQNWNILLKGANDPAWRASPEYAAAHAQVTQPQVTYVQTENGSVPVMTTPQMPPWLQPPTGQQQGTPSAVPSSPAMPGQAPLAYPAPLQTGPTVGAPLPGTEPKDTDIQRRAKQIGSVVQQEAVTILGDGTPENPGTFDSMRDLADQSLNAAGARVGTEPDYQIAAAAIESLAQHYLYVQSGQAAPEGEAKRLAASVTPFPGEAKASIDKKRERIESWVTAVEMAAGGDQMQSAPGAGQPGTVDDILKGYGI